MLSKIRSFVLWENPAGKMGLFARFRHGGLTPNA
jgi:hypothetical protein